MILYTNNKNKVDLKDYPFKLDVHRRRCASRFSPFERDLFYEMCLGSLETTVEELAEDIDVDPAIILSVLKKNSTIGLYSLDGMDVHINKDERKFYEVELEKFNEAYFPNLNYIKSLFNKVPIDVIPQWFSLPKSCSTIFATLIEKHFLTPKLFERYLQELEFDDPILNKLVKELYSSPYYSLNLQELKDSYFLSDEVLYQIVSILEFNLIAVHSYQKIGDAYHEVITPPHEFRTLLIDKLEKRPKNIDEEEKVLATYTLHHDYIPKVTKTLKTIKQLMEDKHETDVQHQDLALIRKLLEIDLLDTVEEQIIVSKEGDSFLSLDDDEKTKHFLVPRKRKKRLFSEWVQRQIEKELIVYTSWIFLEDFINSLQIPLDTHAPMELIRKGRSSFYSIPAYNPDEKEAIRTFLTDHLAIAGIIELAQVEGQLAFRITQFGRNQLT